MTTRRRYLAAAMLAAAAVATITPMLGDEPERTDSLTLAAEHKIYNAEAVVPPQCYTRTFGKFNPCYTCHQTYPGFERPNYMSDGYLQGEYNFSDTALTNHWTNLFVDRSDEVEAISDEAILAYIAEDNYSDLRQRLEARDWQGYLPDLANLQLGADAFGDFGLAKDGSGWVAFNYKPLPSTFWPTNGSTDDVMVRLSETFRETADGRSSQSVYLANLAILEAAIKDLPEIGMPEVDEAELGEDLDGDGTLGKAVRLIRPDHYVGAAADIAVTPMLYPEDTEFLHSVRYVGIEGDEIHNAARMKELRYMKKIRAYNPAQLRTLYGNEHQEKADLKLPKSVNAGDRGLDNGFGWLISGFIEDADGALRPQTYEEQTFCMGCHKTIGTTIDQTFAFARKITGAEGWTYIDTRGMRDAPNVGESEGEILTYLERVGGGNEFRANDEMRDRWFDAEGRVREDLVRAASVHALITPSRERALALNKAYRVLVREQSFLYGRDATIEPSTNVYDVVDLETVPTLPKDRQFRWDIRLDWGEPDSG
jgi:hypothetical protein